MSQIAALLLMYMNEEASVCFDSIENCCLLVSNVNKLVLFQDAFWSLSVLMSDEKHAMHGIYIMVYLFMFF